jgi:hypothetical protein
MFFDKRNPPAREPPCFTTYDISSDKKMHPGNLWMKNFIRIVTVSKLLTVGFLIFGGFFFECFPPVLLLFLVDSPCLAFSGSVIFLSNFLESFLLGFL